WTRESWSCLPTRGACPTRRIARHATWRTSWCSTVPSGSGNWPTSCAPMRSVRTSGAARARRSSSRPRRLTPPASVAAPMRRTGARSRLWRCGCRARSPAGCAGASPTGWRTSPSPQHSWPRSTPSPASGYCPGPAGD
ncbi:MAG: hypothetical protein AVDCRST_MAG88-1432, partial [uncultured Thermomicrobiales bacterium]